MDIKSDSCSPRRSSFATIQNGYVNFKHGESVLISCSFDPSQQNKLIVPIESTTAIKGRPTKEFNSIIVKCIIKDGQQRFMYFGIAETDEVKAPSDIRCQKPSKPTFSYITKRAFTEYREFFRVYDSFSNIEYEVNVMDGAYDDRNNPIYSHILMVSWKPVLH